MIQVYSVPIINTDLIENKDLGIFGKKNNKVSSFRIYSFNLRGLTKNDKTTTEKMSYGHQVPWCKRYVGHTLKWGGSGHAGQKQQTTLPRIPWSNPNPKSNPRNYSATKDIMPL